ncbi:hypothetical protein CEXT_370291 [Caerostris extrusa]|uniref:Uncharacterized protein n=1 Tax=Caerostris extrusa TaxID=172846 RepID=A0AAV4NDU6_CAEEX|nr:hypothetical protein CEXT_370291 [Caerostris extrusa]
MAHSEPERVGQLVQAKRFLQPLFDTQSNRLCSRRRKRAAWMRFWTRSNIKSGKKISFSQTIPAIESFGPASISMSVTPCRGKRITPPPLVTSQTIGRRKGSFEKINPLSSAKPFSDAPRANFFFIPPPSLPTVILRKGILFAHSALFSHGSPSLCLSHAVVNGRGTPFPPPSVHHFMGTYCNRYAIHRLKTSNFDEKEEHGSCLDHRPAENLDTKTKVCLWYAIRRLKTSDFDEKGRAWYLFRPSPSSEFGH